MEEEEKKGREREKKNADSVYASTFFRISWNPCFNWYIIFNYYFMTSAMHPKRLSMSLMDGRENERNILRTLTRQAHLGEVHAVRHEHEISDAFRLRLFPR